MKRIIRPIFLLALLLASGKSFSQVTTVNVVFHVVYKTTVQNIPDSCLQDQLDVLNEDFNAANTDLWKVPTAWVPIIGNMNVNFVLASTDPSGNPSTGIERRQTNVTSWSTNDAVKYFAQGGLDAWPDTSYLNIWVCNLANGLMTYAQLPGGNPATDGIVLHYQATGRGSYCMSPFNLGRNATHSVGHWLGLLHFGPDPGCADIDGIPDTPPYDHTGLYGGYAPFQVVTDNCNPNAPGVMWMNFMTLVDDSSMYFFTQNQVDTMTAVLNMRLGNGGPLGITGQAGKNIFRVYPSPSADGFFSLDANTAGPYSLRVYNMTGELIFEKQGMSTGHARIDLSGFAAGTYLLQMTCAGETENRRISIVR